MFLDFSSNSTVHGVKYLGEKRLHWIERIFWIVVFLLSVSGCFLMINKIYIKWKLTPVIVSLAERSTPVWEIPYPAITICPETKAKKNIIDITKAVWSLVADGGSNLTNDEIRKMEALYQVCSSDSMQNQALNSGLDGLEIVSTLRSIGIPLKDFTFMCTWKNSMINCDEYFSEIFTDEGICYTFNTLNFVDTFKEKK